MTFDTIDLRVLAELQQDSALPNLKLARRVHLSPAPCLARVKALKGGGAAATGAWLLRFRRRWLAEDPPSSPGTAQSRG